LIKACVKVFSENEQKLLLQNEKDSDITFVKNKVGIKIHSQIMYFKERLLAFQDVHIERNHIAEIQKKLNQNAIVKDKKIS
jgi:hypothetical protein